MSYLPEHSDLEDLTADDHSQYLLLTAGTPRPLTGDLYIKKATPSLHLSAAGPVTEWGTLSTDEEETFLLAHGSAAALLYLDAQGATDSTILIGRNTTASGTVLTN